MRNSIKIWNSACYGILYPYGIPYIRNSVKNTKFRNFIPVEFREKIPQNSGVIPYHRILLDTQARRAIFRVISFFLYKNWRTPCFQYTLYYLRIPFRSRIRDYYVTLCPLDPIAEKASRSESWILLLCSWLSHYIKPVLMWNQIILLLLHPWVCIITLTFLIANGSWYLVSTGS